MHPEWSGDFSYLYFRQLLHTARCHFTAHLLSAAPEVLYAIGSPILFLRHDVKLSLHKALRVAEIEHEYGLKATYMVRPDSPLYSLEERQLRLVLWEILQLGHEVGLLFEMTTEHLRGKADFMSIDAQIRAARERLEQLINHQVRAVAFQRFVPEMYVNSNNSPTIFAGGLVNADSSELQHWCLCDAAGCWNADDPLTLFAEPKHRILQLVTHPIWWNEEHLPASERLEEFFACETREISARAAAAFDINLAKTIPAVRRKGLVALVSGGVKA
jgi:hypothetical protein